MGPSILHVSIELEMKMEKKGKKKIVLTTVMTQFESLSHSYFVSGTKLFFIKLKKKNVFSVSIWIFKDCNQTKLDNIFIAIFIPHYQV